MNCVTDLMKPKCKAVVTITINTVRRCSAYSGTSEKENHHSESLMFKNALEGDKLSQVTVKNKKSVINTMKSEKIGISKNSDSTPTNDTKKIKTQDASYRINNLNIQMLSEPLHKQIFRDSLKQNMPEPNVIKMAQLDLEKHGLWKQDVKLLSDVSFHVPQLKGNNIAEHFWNIGNEQSQPYERIVSEFVKNGVPKLPNEWLCQKGWTKYEPGKDPFTVPFPDEKAVVLDIEVCVKLGQHPTLATAVSENAWYGWISSDLAEGINSVATNNYSTDMLIPFEGKSIHKEAPRIIAGHNVSYDRAGIKEQYYIKNSALRFLDTMSLHTCIGGLTKGQKSILKSKTGEYNMEYESWRKYSCLSSLKEIYLLYCGKELIKEARNVFVEGTLQDVRNDFQNLMTYCASDVQATYEVLQVIFPVFLQRFPHPVTLAGMLEMGSAFLTVNSNWKKFLADAEQTYEDLKNEITLVLSKKSDNACRLFHNNEYKNDPWMWSEDWSTQDLKLTKKKLKPKANDEKEKEYTTEKEVDDEEEQLNNKFQYLFDLESILPKRKPFLPGYPSWYRKLCEKPDSQNWTPNTQLSTSMVVTPKLLRLTWENFPLHHTQEFGWGILVADIFAENVETNIPFQILKELTLRNCNIDPEMLKSNFEFYSGKTVGKEKSVVPYYKGTGVWCNHIIDGCCYFFKLPHKDGTLQNVGNPLSKDFSQTFSNSVLRGSDFVAEKVLDLGKKLTYWRNNRQRVLDQMVVWLNKKETPCVNSADEEIFTGVIIPKVVVCGTLTRRAMEATWLTASKVTQNRIGSEMRAMIQAPPGYHIVGADVDSQELWIASLIGDSYVAKIHGSTPLGWMTLSGTKSDETDMHSMTAKAVGISRDHAKVINYARIYGAGVKFAQKLLQQFNPSMSDEEARLKVTKMYALTKGKKVYKVKNSMVEEFNKTFGSETKIFDLSTALKLTKFWGKKVDDVFEKSHWEGGTESAMFNQLERIANSSKPVTPFLKCRLSRALEAKFRGDDMNLTTRMNWVVQSGAVDFLHLMLVCMRWLTNGRARYCFSFHDEVRYLIPSDQRYNAALAMHITNLLVRAFCAYSLGMYDLPQSVAFFSSVEVDKTLRKEADDDCVTPSNPHGIEKGYGIAPGESLNIYEAIQKSGGSLSPFKAAKNQEMSQATKRKHVHREVLEGELEIPGEDQQIVRVLGSRGSNLHEVETPDSSTFLISMPNKFRKNIWIKRGDYILIEPIKEGEKVKAEMVKILTPTYIKFLKKEKLWPVEFLDQKDEIISNSCDDLFLNSNHNNPADENYSTSESE